MVLRMEFSTILKCLTVSAGMLMLITPSPGFAEVAANDAQLKGALDRAVKKLRSFSDLDDAGGGGGGGDAPAPAAAKAAKADAPAKKKAARKQPKRAKVEPEVEEPVAEPVPAVPVPAPTPAEPAFAGILKPDGTYEIPRGAKVDMLIPFVPSRHQVPPEAYSMLRVVGDALRANPDLAIIITGHADSSDWQGGRPGSHSTSMVSGLRGLSVINHLAKSEGIARNRMLSRKYVVNAGGAGDKRLVELELMKVPAGATLTPTGN